LSDLVEQHVRRDTAPGVGRTVTIRLAAGAINKGFASMLLRSSVFEQCVLPALTGLRSYILAAEQGAEDAPNRPARFAQAREGGDDLPYTVELWDADGKSVEQVLAVTAHGSIGYAAYYAAPREYPDRIITLRHRDRTVARSNVPDN
jgi:hypothetical protein